MGIFDLFKSNMRGARERVGMSEERKTSLASDPAAAIFLIVVGFGAFLFFGWVVVIGPWAFDDFLVDMLPWRHEYITSMDAKHFIGHYIFFGFLALIGIFGGSAGVKALVDTIKKRREVSSRIQRAPMESSVFLPLIVIEYGSVWFSMFQKQKKRRENCAAKGF